MIAMCIMDTMDITPRTDFFDGWICQLSKRVSILFDTLAVRGMDVICQYHFIFTIRYVRGQMHVSRAGVEKVSVSQCQQ